METIPKSSCQKIGFIRKTHGVQGEVALEYESQYEESVAEATRFFLEIEGLLVPFFVAADGLRFKSARTALIQFDWTDSEMKARRLIGTAVYLLHNEIIEAEEVNSGSQIVGYHLHDENNNQIGVITAVDDYSGNVVFTIKKNSTEALVPFNEDLLLEMDNQKKIIRLKLPDGLLDL